MYLREGGSGLDKVLGLEPVWNLPGPRDREDAAPAELDTVLDVEHLLHSRYELPYNSVYASWFVLRLQ